MWKPIQMLGVALGALSLLMPLSSAAEPAAGERKETGRFEVVGPGAVKLADWLKESTWKGDFRYRYQTEKLTGGTARNRQRLRMRLAMTAPVNETITFSGRLATGGTGSRSTNATFEDGFAHFMLGLDQAWVDWKATDDLHLLAGKFAMPQVQRGDHLFDSDITFGGMSLVYRKKVRPDFQWSLIGGFYPVDESAADGHDPAMALAQVGFHWKVKPRLEWELYLDANRFRNFQGKDLVGSSHSNTYDAFDDNLDGKIDRWQLANGFNSSNLVSSLYYSTGNRRMPWVGILGNYLDNREVSVEDKAWLLAIAFGEKFQKVKTRGQWSLYLKKSIVQKDAWPDILPDADAFGGRASVKSREVVLDYCLGTGTVFSIDWYHNERQTAGMPEERILQADLSFAF